MGLLIDISMVLSSWFAGAWPTLLTSTSVATRWPLSQARLWQTASTWCAYPWGRILSLLWAMRPFEAFMNLFILTSVNVGWNKCILSHLEASIALNIWGWKPTGSLRFHPLKVSHQTWGKFLCAHAIWWLLPTANGHFPRISPSSTSGKRPNSFY